MKKPSGSFVLWDNTLCNPLAPARAQTKNAWEDGYESGRIAERKELEQELLKLRGGVASVSDYIQGRWDLIGEFQDVLRARSKT